MILAISGDALTTEAVLAQGDGTELVRNQVVNSNLGDSKELLQTLLAPIWEWDVDSPIVCGSGLMGLFDQRQRGAAATLLLNVVPERVKLILFDALEGALAAALEGQPGSLFELGSEVALAHLDADGEFSKRNAPGDLLGADGGFLWLGTRTLQLAARMASGKMPDSPRLMAALEEHLKTDLPLFFRRLEQGSVGPETVASIASVTNRLALYPEPEPACRVLVLQSSRHLAALTEGLPESARVTWSGGTLDGALMEALRELCPWGDTWTPAARPRIDGALLLTMIASREGVEERVEDFTRDHWIALMQASEPGWPLTAIDSLQKRSVG